MAIFRHKPWVNPLGKMSIFRFSELLVFIAQNGVFVVLEYRKRHFPCLYCLKKKLEKWSFLVQNHRLTLFGKMAIFRLFVLLVFIAWKGVFFFQNIVKDIFLDYIAPKKNFRKMAIFDFLNFLFLQPRKAFFRSGIS